jgi:hypothetical protein
MNHPDLETCNKIASEFPNSEFVYHLFREWQKGHFLQINEPSTCDENGVNLRQRPYVIKDEDAKFYIPAPTCEELGEWLLGRAYKETKNNMNQDSVKKYTLGITACWLAPKNGKTETQARAEAVRLILETEK